MIFLLGFIVGLVCGIVGLVCGIFYMALTKVSKDAEITEYEEKKLLEYTTKNTDSDLKNL